MSKKKMTGSNYKAHQRYYYDNKRVPGTTTILGVLNKPALMYWAWDLGMQGIDYKKYVDELAKVGTLVHAKIENHIAGKKLDVSDYTPNQIKLADVGWNKFLEWEENVKPHYLMSEIQLSCATYGGTIDLYAEIDGRKCLVDFKTSKAIYDDQFAQVSAYANLMRENDLEVDEVMILRIGRDKSEGFEVRSISREKEEKYIEVFKHCVEIYKCKKELGWR